MASFRFFALCGMLMAGALLLGNMQSVNAQCGGSIPGLIRQCSQYVAIPGPQVPPSADCCSELKALDIPCICNFVTPPLEKVISMAKVVYCARTCGITVQPGMKCGSYTVPPGASPPLETREHSEKSS